MIVLWTNQLNTFCWKHMDVSENSGTPPIIHFNRVFHYKPSILGYPYVWKHPFTFRHLVPCTPTTQPRTYRDTFTCPAGRGCKLEGIHLLTRRIQPTYIESTLQGTNISHQKSLLSRWFSFSLSVGYVNSLEGIIYLWTSQYQYVQHMIGREIPFLGGGFKYFLCSSLFGEDFQFD